MQHAAPAQPSSRFAVWDGRVFWVSVCCAAAATFAGAVGLLPDGLAFPAAGAGALGVLLSAAAGATAERAEEAARLDRDADEILAELAKAGDAKKVAVAFGVSERDVLQILERAEMRRRAARARSGSDAVS